MDLICGIGSIFVFLLWIYVIVLGVRDISHFLAKVW